MVASWLGMQSVVERLLEEEADINAESKHYGTALNIAAIWEDKEIAGVLLGKGARAVLGGKGYDISKTKLGPGTTEK